MKTEYKVGKWYWFDFPSEGSCIGRFERLSVIWTENSLTISELYSPTGTGRIGQGSFLEKYCKGLATPSQIETCLKAYAEKNGYVVNAQIIDLNGLEKCIGSDITYSGKDYMYDENYALIYENGKWAEIIAHAPSVQNTQDEALPENIHKNLSELKAEINNDDMLVFPPDPIVRKQTIGESKLDINGNMVSIDELIEVYKKMLEIKTIIG